MSVTIKKRLQLTHTCGSWWLCDVKNPNWTDLQFVDL